MASVAQAQALREQLVIPKSALILRSGPAGQRAPPHVVTEVRSKRENASQEHRLYENRNATVHSHQPRNASLHLVVSFINSYSK